MLQKNNTININMTILERQDGTGTYNEVPRENGNA